MASISCLSLILQLQRESSLEKYSRTSLICSRASLNSRILKPFFMEVTFMSPSLQCSLLPLTTVFLVALHLSTVFHVTEPFNINLIDFINFFSKIFDFILQPVGIVLVFIMIRERLANKDVDPKGETKHQH